MLQQLLSQKLLYLSKDIVMINERGQTSLDLKQSDREGKFNLSGLSVKKVGKTN